MMCLVPCMRKTCKGKVQSACYLMNVFPFLSLLVTCFQKTTMWKVGAFYFFSQLSFAFYFLVLTEYISNIDGKLNFFLSKYLLISGLCITFHIGHTHFQSHQPQVSETPFNLKSSPWWISASHRNLRVPVAVFCMENDTILLLLF